LQKLVRKLDNKLWLDKEISEKLHGGEIQGDALKNFRSSKNRLSLFIADETDNIIRIAAAIAAGGDKDKVSNIDYAIIDRRLLDQHDIQYEKCPGETPDSEINELHVDLVNLTARKINLLAELIQNHGTLERLSGRKVEQAIREGLANGFLAKDRVKIKTA
jgi:hypothetical protein